MTHNHRQRPDGDDRPLLVAFALLTAFLVGEVVAAALASSLALLADAGHMLTDALALLMAVVAGRIARRPAGGVWTFGFGRAEILSASINGVSLLVVAAVVAVEAVRRLISPADVAGAAVVVVAIIGLAVNLLATLVLTRADRGSLNIAGAIVHVTSDAYAFAATLVAGIVIVTTGWRQADPVASLVVVALMLRAAAGLLRRSGAVLLERAPEGVDLGELRGHLLGTRGVVDVHDLHAWSVGAGLPAVSAHIVVGESCFADGAAPQLLDELQRCLAGHFDVEHSTFQLEPVGHTEHEAPGH